jgi:hypothetical protein
VRVKAGVWAISAPLAMTAPMAALVITNFLIEIVKTSPP